MTAKKRARLPRPAQLRKQIQSTAAAILEADPDPGVRCRLLRDVFQLADEHPDHRAACQTLEQSEHIQRLITTQQADGGWGRFHTRDSRTNAPVPTTEWAVERALALGMSRRRPLLRRAARHAYDLLTWKAPFPDPAEKNQRWRLGWRLFTAAVLARLDPQNPILDSEQSMWLKIASRTFASGSYNPTDEMHAHNQLTGTEMRDSYLVLNGRYQLVLLGSVADRLPEPTERALLAWLWQYPYGVGYYQVPLGLPAPKTPSRMERWLASHELLMHTFPRWASQARPVLAWLWQQRQPDGLWDFGARTAGTAALPLSESWRRAGRRQVDWTVRILALIQAALPAARPGETP
jgi:hypothetical protein